MECLQSTPKAVKALNAVTAILVLGSGVVILWCRQTCLIAQAPYTC